MRVLTKKKYKDFLVCPKKILLADDFYHALFLVCTNIYQNYFWFHNQLSEHHPPWTELWPSENNHQFHKQPTLYLTSLSNKIRTWHQNNQHFDFQAEMGLKFHSYVYKHFPPNPTTPGGLPLYHFQDFSFVASVDQTQQVLASPGEKVIYEAAFSCAGMRAKTDILWQHSDQTVSIYEVKTRKYQNLQANQTQKKDKAALLYDLYYQWYLLTKLGYKVTGLFLIFLPIFPHQKYQQTQNLLDEVVNLQSPVVFEKHVQKIKKLEAQADHQGWQEALDLLLSPQICNPENPTCYHTLYFGTQPLESVFQTKYSDCKYLSNHLFDLPRVTKKICIQFFNSTGKIWLKDLPTNKKKLMFLTEKQDRKFLTLTKNRRRVIIFNHSSYHWMIDKRTVEQLLADYQYPVFMYDFETFFFFPVGDDYYSFVDPGAFQIPFLYSVHVVDQKWNPTQKNGAFPHFKFLVLPNLKHWQLVFIEHFLTDMYGENISKPKSTCYVAYYSSFEKNVILGMINVVTKYQSTKVITSDYSQILICKLQYVYDHTIDLALFFKDINIYSSQLNGKFSIKKVLPALVTNLSYDHLAIQNGLAAANLFSRLFYKMIALPEWQQKYAQDLLQYSKLDTLAMVLIFFRIQELNSSSAVTVGYY